MGKKRFKPSWKWAFGNKRQRGKVRHFFEKGCGCNWCCPEDRRRKIRDRDDRRDQTDRSS